MTTDAAPTDPKLPAELMLVEPPALSVQGRPDQVLAEAASAAKALKGVIDGKPHPVRLGGKTYLEFEDWQTVARFYGLTAKVLHTQAVTIQEADASGTLKVYARGYEADAVAIVVSTGQEISRAESMCLTDEPKWAGKPLFQLRSMAQTRACAKVLRNVLAWVVVLAGYGATPAEELPIENPTPKRSGARTAETKPRSRTKTDTTPDPPTDAPPPAPAPEQTPLPTAAPTTVERTAGARILATEYVTRTGMKPHWVITTSRGVFVTRDPAIAKDCEVCEETNHAFVLTWKPGTTAKGEAVKNVIAMALDDEMED
jgi:hypothetical protein